MTSELKNALLFNGWIGEYRVYHRYPRCVESYDQMYGEFYSWDQIHRVCNKRFPSLIQFLADQENQGHFWQFVEDIDGNKLWSWDD